MEKEMKKIGLWLFIIVCLLLAAIAVPVFKVLGFIIGIVFSMIGSIFVVAIVLFMVGYAFYLAIRESREEQTVDQFTKSTTTKSNADEFHYTDRPMTEKEMCDYIYKRNQKNSEK